MDRSVFVFRTLVGHSRLRRFSNVFPSAAVSVYVVQNIITGFCVAFVPFARPDKRRTRRRRSSIIKGTRRDGQATRSLAGRQFFLSSAVPTRAFCTILLYSALSRSHVHYWLLRCFFFLFLNVFIRHLEQFFFLTSGGSHMYTRTLRTASGWHDGEYIVSNGIIII